MGFKDHLSKQLNEQGIKMGLEKYYFSKSLEKYPEFGPLVRELNKTYLIPMLKEINVRAKDIDSKMPYKAQFVLEELIKILEEKV